MTYSFDEMKSGKKRLYKTLWDVDEFKSEDFITKTSWTGRESDDSFFIKAPITEFFMSKLASAIAADLINAFDIKEDKRNLFTKKTEQACSGSGEEALKITTMHSSSLCSLLCFYGVSEENEEDEEKNKLVLELGNGENKSKYEFTESYFEFQNEVIAGRQPSNMDVVLIGHLQNQENKNVVLFLESKFSEYLSASSSLEISMSYRKNEYGKIIYDRLEKTGNYDVSVPKNKDGKEDEEAKNFKLVVKNEAAVEGGKKTPKKTVYLEGIKQMISHYIGIRNLLDRKLVRRRNCACHDKVVDLVKNGATVLLGTILFEDSYQGSKCFIKYKESYGELVKELNEVTEDLVANTAGCKKGFTVLEEPLTYAGVFTTSPDNKFELDEKVKKYYFRES